MGIFKNKTKSRGDESWSPKARVGPLLPKMNRPAREGTKKVSVEKVLEATAKRTPEPANNKVCIFKISRLELELIILFQSPKRQYKKKKVKTKTPLLAKTTPPAVPSTSGSTQQITTTTTTTTTHTPVTRE